MRNLRLQIEYEGTNYAGWQAQNRGSGRVARDSHSTIQETIEKVLEKILQEKVKVIGSGRTDAGVHALAQAANFKTNSRLTPAKIQKALNGLLPDDIRIKKVNYADDNFHACYSARSKVYRYIILNNKVSSVFLKRYSWHIPYKLNMALMRKEARALIGRHDFSSFCASGSSARTRVRTIKKITIAVIASPAGAKQSFPVITMTRKNFLITIDIEADGFLYNMARNILGTLVEIGRGRFNSGSMEKILLAKNRIAAGPTAPARGLFLVKVRY